MFPLSFSETSLPRLKTYVLMVVIGIILRPGFIYKRRRLNGVEISLNIVGRSLERILATTTSFTRLLPKLCASNLLLHHNEDLLPNFAFNAYSDSAHNMEL